MPNPVIPFYKKIPSLKLLLPLIVGILCQYYFNIEIVSIIILAGVSIALLLFYRFLPTAKKFVWGWISGVAVSLLFIALGCWLCYANNIEHRKEWIGNYYKEGTPVLVTIQEPLTERAKSYKTLASADAVWLNGKWQVVKGDMLLYFKKDETKPDLHYGSQIIVGKGLVRIQNAGNPGGFDYARFCSFQDIYYQSFLKDEDFRVLPSENKNFFQELLVNAQIKTLSILKKYIPGSTESGVAEALLIGYRNDLDRDLVQSYSNTGVVHIIAISGLHIAMIYGLMIWLLFPFAGKRWIKVIRPLLILSVIWGFTFLAGAVPSILRSAVMFSFIILGECLGKRTDIYNSLSASALLILLFNPFSLWDAGFQLSYAAVLSIVVFHKHIVKWVHFENKLLKELWSLNAVTLSAQILTLPLVLYYFHQFPTYFLIANLFAVTFSGWVLYAEILLLIVSSIPYVALYVGKLIAWSIGFMNDFIVRVDNLPSSVWGGIQISIIQAILLYLTIAFFAAWLINKYIKGFIIGLISFTLFIAFRSIDLIQKNEQQKLVVYNVPQHAAIDIIDGRHYCFLGDDTLRQDGFLRSFHLKPARVLNRVSETDSLENILIQNNIITSSCKRIIIIDKPINPVNIDKKIKVDAIILTKNPKVYLSQLSQVFDCQQYISDGSNPDWKIRFWKKDADSLHLRLHSTAQQGAFVMDL